MRQAILWTMAVLLALGAVPLQAGEPAANSTVTLSWADFVKITGYDPTVKGAQALTIPWSEVEALLGIKVEQVGKGASVALPWQEFKALLQWSIDTKAGKVGVSICYDRHYPEYMRALALAGAELVVVPQAGAVGEWPEGLYEAELQVAAFQNGYFTALCNRVGREECLDFAGESFVCDPDGRVVARAPQSEDHILFADIDLAEVADSHAKKLFFRDRRPELYAEWLAKQR